MRESFYNKDPLVLDGSEPDTAEEVAQAPQVAEAVATVSAETASNNLFTRGEERFKESGAALSSLKDRAVAFFAKIPQVAMAWTRKVGTGIAEGARNVGAGISEGARNVRAGIAEGAGNIRAGVVEGVGNVAAGTAEFSRSAAIAVFSTPELYTEAKRAIGETGGMVQEGLERGGAAAMEGLDRFGSSVNSGIDSAAMWALNNGEAVAEFARTKQEQFGTYLTQKGEAVKAVGELAGNWSAEKAEQARGAVDTSIRNVTEWGAMSLVAANAKRLEIMKNFKDRATAAKLESLKREADAAFADKQAAEERHQRITQKLELMGALA